MLPRKNFWTSGHRLDGNVSYDNGNIFKCVSTVKQAMEKYSKPVPADILTMMTEVEDGSLWSRSCVFKQDLNMCWRTVIYIKHCDVWS